MRGDESFEILSRLHRAHVEGKGPRDAAFEEERSYNLFTVGDHVVIVDSEANFVESFRRESFRDEASHHSGCRENDAHVTASSK